ncbi:MAG TPA: hypothetical protein VM890_15135, partial [Longimicrobium sp.]|nr:hypothetical protein [Longimicrobium sp.]
MKGLSLRTKVFFLFAGAALLIVVPALLLIANAVEERAYASATEALSGAGDALESWNLRGESFVGAAQLRAAVPDVVDAWREHRPTLGKTIRAGLDSGQVVIAMDSAFRPRVPYPGVDLEVLAGAAGQGTVVVLPRKGQPLRLGVARMTFDTPRYAEAEAGSDSGRVESGRDTLTLGYLAIGDRLTAAQIKKEAATPGTEVTLLVGDSLVSTTFPDTVRPALRDFLRRGRHVQKPSFHGQTYLWSSYRIPAGGEPTTIVLFRRV